MSKNKILSQSTMLINMTPNNLDNKKAQHSPSSTQQTKSLLNEETANNTSESSSFNIHLESIYDAVLITDASGNILNTNSRTTKFLGHSKEELTRMNIKDVISGATDSLVNLIRKNLVSQRYTVIDGYCIRADASTFSAEIAANKTHMSNPEKLCFFIRDTTRRKEMEAELRHANKMKSNHTLVAGVAHDFNNLLTSVIGHTELAIASMSIKSKAHEDLSVALKDAQKMADLSRRILAYSGKGVLHNEKVNVTSILNTVQNKTSSNIPEHINLHAKISPTPITVGGEHDLIASIIENILANAIEAIGNKHGDITIGCHTENITSNFIEQNNLKYKIKLGLYACIEITDTGYGMDDVLVEKIFDPFFSTKGAGRGLGLSEAQGIAFAHGGAITVESKIGKGSTFTVLIPFTNSPSQIKPTRKTSTNTNISNATILVVDDEPSIRRYAQRILGRNGCTIFTADNGVNGINEFRTHADEIDLVLLDMFMPQMNGNQVLKTIRKIRPDIKVLLASGYTESVYSDSFDKEQPTGFLYKPFATDEFLATINETLASAKSSDEHITL